MPSKIPSAYEIAVIGLGTSSVERTMFSAISSASTAQAVFELAIKMKAARIKYGKPS